MKIDEIDWFILLHLLGHELEGLRVCLADEGRAIESKQHALNELHLKCAE